MRSPLALLPCVLLVACAGEVVAAAHQQASDESGIDAAGSNDNGSPQVPDGPPSQLVGASDDDSDSSFAGDGQQAGEPAGSGAEPVPESCGDNSGSLVENLEIDQVALYQTVKIPLLTAGVWVEERNAPVVAGKEALLRVFVQPATGFTPHAVRAEVQLQNGDEVTRLEASLTPRGASTDENLATTFNVRLPAEALTANTAVSVALVEAKCDPTRAKPAGARVPEVGFNPLAAQEVGPLRVVLVPVQMGTLTPDTDAQVDAIRAALLAHYPVPEVAVTVAAPLPWRFAVNASGVGWAELLNEVKRQRQRDQVGRDVYYFGLVTPKANFGAYCGGVCVAGMAPQTITVSSADQVGLGVGFGDQNSYETVVHELGHAHGRAHAPCSPGGRIRDADPLYPSKPPYTGGSIGSWGWDARSGQLMAPTRKDVMGYCDPSWISDYTYAALAKRSLAVNAALTSRSRPSVRASVEPTVWQSLILYADGTTRWAAFSTTEIPGGEREALRVLDAQGQVLQELEAARVPLAHGEASFLYVPEPEPDWAVLELASGLTISLDAVLPPLL